MALLRTEGLIDVSRGKRATVGSSERNDRFLRLVDDTGYGRDIEARAKLQEAADLGPVRRRFWLHASAFFADLLDRDNNFPS